MVFILGLMGLNEAMSSEAPPAPDAERLMSQQARLNRINQFTPFGSLTFEGPDRTTARLQLDPQTQQLVEQLQGVAGQRAGQIPGQAFSPDIPAVGGTGAGALGPFDQSTQAQQATFQQAQNLLDPVFERREENLRQTLANQGLPIGSEAFEGEFNRFERERNRADVNAALQSVQAGNQRQNQLFQQGLSALGAQGSVRQQNLGELQTLLGTAQGAGPQMGSFFGPSATDVTGPAQLQQRGQMAQFQADQQQQQALMGGLSSLGSAAILASDRRLKRHIQHIGSVMSLPLYLFRYVWSDDWHIGHMADEVEKVYPSAVLRHPSGYLMVDYSQVWHG